jgi:hypothetical protein
MPLGIGLFFDRRRRRYISIHEHASDVIAHPRRFRAQMVAGLDPVRDRSVIIRHVASQGFVRVRWWRGDLGWEFASEAEDAVRTLKSFIRRRGVGPVVVVNISDFASGISILRTAAQVLTAGSAAELGLSSDGRLVRTLVESANEFAAKALAVHRQHPALVAGMEHGRRVQKRLREQGITDAVILSAAQLFPLFPGEILSLPLHQETMALADALVEAAGIPVTQLAEAVADQLGNGPRRRRERLSSEVRVIVQADVWCREHATPLRTKAVPGRSSA